MNIYRSISQIFIVALLTSFLCFPESYAQEASDPADFWRNPTTNDFSEIQQKMEAFYATHPTGKGTGYKQWKRWEWNTEMHLGPDGKITNWTKRNFDEYHRFKQSSADRTWGGFWFPLAPTSWVNGNSGYLPGLGRVNCVAFHPSNVNTIYIGMPAGGLWRTTNGGTTWVPLTDGIPSIGVSGIAIHPTNANIIYILTGDGDGSHTFSVGVLKTTNGGDTWQSTDLSWDVVNQRRGYKLMIDPNNGNHVLAATTLGLYRTTNGGSSWTVVQAGSFRDIERKPGDANVIYAVTTNAFYRSPDNGANWNLITSGLPAGETRVAIAVTADNPSYVYYLAGPPTGNGSFVGVYRSFDSGVSFGAKANTPNILSGQLAGGDNTSQTTYDLAIAVSGVDEADVVTGGVNIWRSTDWANNFSINAHWSIVTAANNGLEYTHGDIHNIEVNPLNNFMYVCSDGGIYRSTDHGVNWTDISSGLRIMQFYRIADFPGNANLVVGGTQDCGTNTWTGGGSITHIDGADGMDCMIDYNNSNIIYHTRQRGSLWRSTNGGSTHTFIRPGNTQGAWVTPIAMHPTTSTTIYAGYNDTIYRSTNSGTGWTGSIPQAGSGLYRFIWACPNNSNRIYVSTNTRIFRMDNWGSWTNITGTLPTGGGRNITSITTDINNSGEVWVTLAGYTAGSKVFFSPDAGVTWNNISGSLPNLPANVVIYDDTESGGDNAVYVGTDVGVFYRDVNLTDWVPFMNGLPNVPIRDLEVHVSSSKLRAGTFGRGLWESNLYSSCPTGWTLTNANMPGETISGADAPGYRVYRASSTIHSSRFIDGGVGTDVYYSAGNYVEMTTGFEVIAGSEFLADNEGCASGIPFAPAGIYEGPMEGAETTFVPDDLISADRYVRVYPNPFSSLTNVEFKLVETGDLRIYITDMLGRMVRILADEDQHDPGTYNISFRPDELSEGVYFCNYELNGETETIKLIHSRQ